MTAPDNPRVGVSFGSGRQIIQSHARQNKLRESNRCIQRDDFIQTPNFQSSRPLSSLCSQSR